jgi:hypothetical protein
MISIPFKKYNFKISYQADKPFIFDIIRKKNILLTPEEWVRQNFIHYLIEDLNYPKGKIAVEKEFTVNNLKKRFDLLVYDQQMQPFLLIECKSPEIKLSENTITQVTNYNSLFKSKYILISNGNQTFCFENGNESVVQLSEIPVY